jgi:hypothetical protein
MFTRLMCSRSFSSRPSSTSEIRSSADRPAAQHQPAQDLLGQVVGVILVEAQAAQIAEEQRAVDRVERAPSAGLRTRSTRVIRVVSDMAIAPVFIVSESLTSAQLSR